MKQSGNTIRVHIIFIGLMLIGGCQSASPVSRALAPVAVITGADSHVKTKESLLIKSPADLRKQWLRHLGQQEDSIYNPGFEVDFDRCFVVAIFDGATTNIAGFHVDAISENAAAVVLRFMANGYQTSAAFGQEDHGKSATPFAFIVIAKTDKPISLERDVQNMIGGEPVWREVARLK